MPFPRIEIACDESGFSGGNLVGPGHSGVFAHASVRLDLVARPRVVQRRAPVDRCQGRGVQVGRTAAATTSDRAALAARPDRSAPGASRVHLVDTRFFVLDASSMFCSVRTRCPASDLPAREVRSRPIALTLYRSGDRAYGTRTWQTS